MFRRIALSMAMIAGLNACAEIEAVVSDTLVGARDGGLLGGTGAFARSALTACRRADGAEFQVPLDLAVIAFDAQNALEEIRAARRRACERYHAIAVLTTAVIPEIPANSPTRE